MPATATRLDWLSFTLQVDTEYGDHPKKWLPEEVLHYVNNRTGLKIAPKTFVPERGRWPYDVSAVDRGIRVFWTPGSLEVLIEISGEGCERLNDSGKLEALVGGVIDRISRIDIATDIQTKTDPRDFVAERTNKRHKSHETSVSTTGITCYVGSRRSDRFARVYRYSAPHPRAALLRIEQVYRGQQARALGRTWLEHGNEETAARAGNQYGWAHPDWAPKSEERVKAWRPDRASHKRMHWYETQVLPALRKMVLEGHLTPEQLMMDLKRGEERKRPGIPTTHTSDGVERATS
jgi:hypothetical protein